MNLSKFTKDNKYLMLALDQRGSFRKLISPNNPDSVQSDLAIRYKGEILSSIYNLYSGLLIDFDYGLPAYNLLPEASKPFLLPAEKTGYTEENGDRLTEIKKSAEEIKESGASGVKLLVYYNPTSETAEKQIQTAKKVLIDAHEHNLPFFLEILNYDIEPDVVASVRDFVDSGVIPDVFKLEFPGNITECSKVTEILDGTPWIVLTKGVDFPEFEVQLKTSVEGGCAGFLAGRALWKEYLQIQDTAERDTFLVKTLPTRFKIISDIVLQK